MPSYRVNEPTVSLSTFDVVGRDGEQLHFISHTGLSKSTSSQDADRVTVVDMGPPLHGSAWPCQMPASAVGRAELTDDEVRKIQTFVDRHANEHQGLLQLSGRQLLKAAPEMYCVYPHTAPFPEEDGRYVRTRFSCAGFVLEAYRAARIGLVEPNALPAIDMTVIKAAYPTHVGLMERGTISGHTLGLVGPGPWRVLLCGYLLHALNRAPNVIRQGPYAPIAEDQYFRG